MGMLAGRWMEPFVRALYPLRLACLRVAPPPGEQARLIRQMEPCDILLTRASGEISTFFFPPGDFTHSALALSRGVITDATGEGVGTRPAEANLDHAARAVLLRPRLSQPERDRVLARAEAVAVHQIPYNWALTASGMDAQPDGWPQRLTCVQYVFFLLAAAETNHRPWRPLPKRRPLMPRDIYLDRERFAPVITISGGAR